MYTFYYRVKTYPSHFRYGLGSRVCHQVDEKSFLKGKENRKGGRMIHAGSSLRCCLKIHISSSSNSTEGHSHPRPGETVLQSFSEFELEFERFLLFLYSTICLDTVIGLCLTSSMISWYKI